MTDKVKYRTDSKGVKVKLTFDEKNKVWRSSSPEFDQTPLPKRRESSTTSKEHKIIQPIQPKQESLPKRGGLGAALRGGGRAFYKGGKV